MSRRCSFFKLVLGVKWNYQASTQIEQRSVTLVLKAPRSDRVSPPSFLIATINTRIECYFFYQGVGVDRNLNLFLRPKLPLNVYIEESHLLFMRECLSLE